VRKSSYDETRTVCGSGRIPVLEIIKEEDTITIFEADDMDRQITFSADVVPLLITYLENLK
jgi:hypothetical protein